LYSRAQLIEQLFAYQSVFTKEQSTVKEFLSLLHSPNCFFRDHLPGHLTGSAWIVNEDASHVLLLHHAKLNKWLQPGGHADGDENIYAVALREAIEETGIKEFKLLKSGIFDVDIHPIPARKDFPEHLHFDVRFLFQATANSAIHISDESHDVQWIPVQNVPEQSNHNASILRMIQKTIAK
jgi:8-oxo-dGTP pyrophosphatase MutT (NUDIX family)